MAERNDFYEASPAVETLDEKSPAKTSTGEAITLTQTQTQVISIPNYSLFHPKQNSMV